MMACHLLPSLLLNIAHFAEKRKGMATGATKPRTVPVGTARLALR